MAVRFSFNFRGVGSGGVCLTGVGGGVSVNEGINGVCFGWGTARGRGSRDCERVSGHSTTSTWTEPRRNHGESVRKMDPLQTVNRQMSGFPTRTFIGIVLKMMTDEHRKNK